MPDPLKFWLHWARMLPRQQGFSKVSRLLYSTTVENTATEISVCLPLTFTYPLTPLVPGRGKDWPSWWEAEGQGGRILAYTPWPLPVSSFWDWCGGGACSGDSRADLSLGGEDAVGKIRAWPEQQISKCGHTLAWSPRSFLSYKGGNVTFVYLNPMSLSCLDLNLGRDENDVRHSHTHTHTPLPPPPLHTHTWLPHHYRSISVWATLKKHRKHLQSLQGTKEKTVTNGGMTFS